MIFQTIAILSPPVSARTGQRPFPPPRSSLLQDATRCTFGPGRSAMAPTLECLGSSHEWLTMHRFQSSWLLSQHRLISKTHGTLRSFVLNICLERERTVCFKIYGRIVNHGFLHASRPNSQHPVPAARTVYTWKRPVGTSEAIIYMLTIGSWTRL